MGLKRYMPRSLFGRALVILVAPMVVLQAVVAFIFIQRHYEGVTEQMARAVARELNYAVEAVETAETAVEAARRLEDISGPLGMQLGLAEGGAVGADALIRFYDVSGSAVEETFKRDVDNPMTLDLVTSDKTVDARIQTDKGVLRALIPRRRMIAANPHLLLVWMFVTAAILVAVAVIFLRNQIRPIRELATAADAFGKGRGGAFRPAGADEVRLAGAAFLDMRTRIERQIEQRTKMLSGVSHDLRTPLTRMKLALAVAAPGPETDELQQDVADMERMLEEFLAFARGEQGEEAEPANPVAIAERAAADARRRGGRITVLATVATPDQPTALLRPMAIQRALQNLVDNALAHGDRVELTVRLQRKFVEFAVEDDGPGIPEAEREAAFRPFHRLDEARNQDRGGGVGLGLSIALDAARAHGGEILLDDSTRLGGLRARMKLPR